MPPIASFLLENMASGYARELKGRAIRTAREAFER
jgi:hypothetical protein